jgi:hypothetical protein
VTVQLFVHDSAHVAPPSPTEQNSLAGHGDVLDT